MIAEPLVYMIAEAKRAIAVGTTTLYRLIGAGTLDARKSGNRTVITAASLRAYAENLPKAEIHTGRRDA